jgi:hypothetical protein
MLEAVNEKNTVAHQPAEVTVPAPRNPGDPLGFTPVRAIVPRVLRNDGSRDGVRVRRGGKTVDEAIERPRECRLLLACERSEGLESRSKGRRVHFWNV